MLGGLESRLASRTARTLVLTALCAALAGCAPSLRGASPAAPDWDEAANARYAGIEDGPVDLADGAWEGEPFDPDGFARPHVVLVPDFWMAGDLDADGAPEAVVLLAGSSGAAGSDLYVAALARREGAVVNTGTALVGNRVQVRDARVENGRIALDVVQAGPSDAMCCPGEKATRVFAFEGKAFVEVDARVTGRLAPGDLSGVEWLLVKTGDAPVPAEPAVTLAVEGTRVHGAAGCNGYVGELRAGAAPGELAIVPRASSRKECAEAAMALESRYLAALEHVRRFSFVAGRLVLVSPEGAHALWFHPRAPGR
jgi:heat shock protein HslJ